MSPTEWGVRKESGAEKLARYAKTEAAFWARVAVISALVAVSCVLLVAGALDALP